MHPQKSKRLSAEFKVGRPLSEFQLPIELPSVPREKFPGSYSNRLLRHVKSDSTGVCVQNPKEDQAM